MNEGKSKDTLTDQQADELNRLFKLGKYAGKHPEPSSGNDGTLPEDSTANRAG